MKLFKMLKFADYITLSNLGSGFLSILFSFKGEFLFAVGFLLLAVVFDALDGVVARKRNEVNHFGKELDSLSDLVSFGVAPAVFGFALGLNSFLAMVVLVFFVLAGGLRLCRFNVTSVEGFEGVPITFNGLIFPLLYFVSLFLAFPLTVYLVCYMVMALLMVSSFKVKKLW